MQDIEGAIAYVKLAAGTPLFSGIDIPSLEARLAEPGIRVETYEKGSLLYSSVDGVRCIGLLVSGSARVTKNDGGGRMLMSVLHVGDVFGAATLFASTDCFVANIHAMSAARAILIPEETWLSMMQADFRIAKNYMAYLTARIRFLSARIDGFVTPTVEDRVLSFMRSRAKEGVYRPETSIRAIGDALCISRTSLYRAFDALEQSGRMIKEGRNIRLLQEEEK